MRSTNVALAGAALAALCVTSPGCRRSGGNRPRLSFPTSPAAGRPSTCPEDAVDPGGMAPGLGPMDVRCSYDDAAGGGLVQLRGQVLLEPDPGTLPEPVAEVTLTVHRNGSVVGRATTDAQGTYSVSLNLKPGEYELRVVTKDTGEVLATRRVNVPDGATNMAGLDLIVTMDPRLRKRSE
jgi:hypothetical protein